MEKENKLLKNILMISSYFIYQIIPLFIVMMLGISLNTNTDKIIYSFIVNLIYLFFVIFMYRIFSIYINYFKRPFYV